MDLADSKLLKQHVIDPEICIRCNTCEATCPVGAVTHDSRNYVVDADKCNFCMACIPPCPTGSIDNWRVVPKAKAYSLDEQLGWDELPAALSAEQLSDTGADARERQSGARPERNSAAAREASARGDSRGCPYGADICGAGHGVDVVAAGQLDRRARRGSTKSSWRDIGEVSDKGATRCGA